MTTLLPHVEINTGSNPDAAVIWLHGLGADGNDFAAIVPELDLTGCPAIRFVFPHAPSIPVTINGGYVMPAWYDIFAADLQRREDDAGIRRSALAIEALIARENQRGVDTRRIMLAGFSQGCAVALHTGLRHPQPLAGIIALSGYLPLADSLASEASAAKTSPMRSNADARPRLFAAPASTFTTRVTYIHAATSAGNAKRSDGSHTVEVPCAVSHAQTAGLVLIAANTRPTAPAADAATRDSARPLAPSSAASPATSTGTTKSPATSLSFPVSTEGSVVLPLST